MKRISIMTTAALMTLSCGTPKEDSAASWSIDRFADIEVLRYEVPGFENLSLQQKKLIFCLSEAAQWGRDLLWDQNCKYNLQIREVCESVFVSYKGDRNDTQWKAFEQYMKQVWFANGIHHHYSNAKFKPGF
ncbi:MAG: dihydrofolate reductase, partial [Bacteroidales bacterium]|nr:dihydrofolate reductase [Bacteroidales bacterium]